MVCNSRMVLPPNPTAPVSYGISHFMTLLQEQSIKIKQTALEEAAQAD